MKLKIKLKGGEFTETVERVTSVVIRAGFLEFKTSGKSVVGSYSLLDFEFEVDDE